MPVEPCPNADALTDLLAESGRGPVVIFKHSTRCPISGAAEREMSRFVAAHPDVPCRQVLVIEQRPLSLEIAAVTGVAHQSPQVLVLRNGAVAWTASHYGVTCAEVEEACAAAKG
ncbi:MAG TPA: bacillithiol system redox-active protein YtxJ [Armatimonadota bacterium]|nr:bacillithiol system redox-active protein YtxJ [Armatimonadota bacterium]